jgi:hypothetical protein
MRGPNRKRDQIGIQGVTGVLAKKLRIRWKQAGIQDLQNARKVNLRIFRIGMISVNQNGDDRQQQQSGYAANDAFDIQSVPIHFSTQGTDQEADDGLRFAFRRGELHQKMPAAGSWGKGAARAPSVKRWQLA